MKIPLNLLIGHIVLLILASTNFSILSWLWGDIAWSWDYFTLSYRNGWGYTYASEYSLGQVLCYIAAYGIGVAAFGSLWFQHQLRLSALGAIVSVLGMVSFCIEASHWLWNHHLSMITSSPALMAILWIFVAIQLRKHPYIRKPNNNGCSGVEERDLRLHP